MSAHSGPGQIAAVPRISLQAFCETAELSTTISEALGDRRMEKAHVKVHMGGAAAALESYRTAPTPNVIILEMTGDRGDLIDNLEKLAEFCDLGTKVVVIGRVNDISLYRDLMSRGVSDYLVTPLSVLDFIRAISALYASEGSPPVGRTIAVAGVKGGVGASTIAHNLAWAIARDLEIQTVIADLDLGFGTTGLDFNQDPPQGIADAVFAPDRLDANLVDRLLSKCSQKLSILAAPAMLDRVYDLGEDAFDALIDILKSSTPSIVLDVPHIWTAWTRRVLVAADEIVIVCAPDLANLRNAKSMFDMLRSARPNDAPPRLVLNGVGVQKRPEIATADFVKAIDLPASAVVPYEPKLFGTAANNGQMIAEVEATSRAATTILELARLVTSRAENRRSKRPIWHPIVSRLSARKAS